MSLDGVTLRCVGCGAEYPGGVVRYRCDCGETLDAVAPLGGSVDLWEGRLSSSRPEDRSGVWRFREVLVPAPPESIVTRGEGATHLYDSPQLAEWVGLARLRLKHEGENPTGSFKDRGMTVGVTVARLLGMSRVACASTGNTSASMASYAAMAGMQAIVFIPEGNIAFGKLSQALAYGARTIQIDGDFDRAMALVEEVAASEGIYLLNSLNPFRVEGQKTIGIELLADLGFEVPDWVVMPGGNLGNCSAIGKAFRELREMGIIERTPRLAVIQASGANPLYRAVSQGTQALTPVDAETLATAIRIGNPVSWRRALREIGSASGVVEEVTDQQIMDAKAAVDRAGIGAEPASCASVAGIRKLVAAGTIEPDETVCAILTGNLLKDPDTVVRYHRGELSGIKSTSANAPVSVPADLEAVLSVIRN